MAKRFKPYKAGKGSKSSGELVLIVLVIILAIAVLFAVIVPPLLPLLWLIFEIRDRELGVPKSGRAFALTSAEWDELERARGDRDAFGDRAAEKIASTVEELEGRPAARWKAWLDGVESLWGNRVGLACGFASFAIVLLTRMTPMNGVYAGMRSELFASCGKLADDPTFIGVSLMLLPLVAWLIGALVGWSIGAGKAKHILAEPGPVGRERDADNELADEGARQDQFVGIRGQAAGIAAAAIASLLSLVLIIAAVLGKI